MIPLLILRPEPGASTTARRAAAIGLTPLIQPLFVVEPVAWDAPDPALFDALVLTSANAIRNGGCDVRLYRHLPAYAVGAATATAARDSGLGHVVEGTGSAADALHALAAAGYSRPLHLSGEDRTAYPHLPFSITTRTLYKARPLDVTLPAGRLVALLHSARAAARFATVCPTRDTVDVIAISETVASAAKTGWRSVSASPQPSDNAMLALAAMLCDGRSSPSGPK